MTEGVLSAFVQWALGGLAAFTTAVGGVVYRNRERSLTNKHRLEGDPANPSDEGLMDIVYETREEQRQLQQRMDRDHREVMSKLDEIKDGKFEVGD